jgi:signal transduction histidine kinase
MTVFDHLQNSFHAPTPQDSVCLTLDSTLQDLPLWNQQIDAHEQGRVLAQFFEADPLLPGTLLLKQKRFSGMISRRRFLEVMSRPYALELFLKRPLEVLYPFIPHDSLILEGSTSIVAAVPQALQRSPEHRYEPLLVAIAPEVYQILDFHDLLMAHSQIHQLAKQTIQDQSNAQMMQAEKMANLGRILATVSHEILNPVNFISGNLTYLSDYVQSLINLITAYQIELKQPSQQLQELEVEMDIEFLKSDLPNMIESMKVGAEHLRQIAGGLRTFSRVNGDRPKAFDVHQCLDNSLLILKGRLKGMVEVVRHYGDVPFVNGFSGLLGQVIMNILNNAIDALLEKQSQRQEEKQSALDHHNSLELSHPKDHNWQPQITIITEVIDQAIEADPKRATSPITSWLSLRIMDNGPGIPAEVQARMFETFFTTKSAERGTGLGLAISHQIVTEKHHGQLNCSSTLGVGTTFEILLPLE